MASYADANRFRRLVRRFAGTAPGAWSFARLAPHADRVVDRLTGGRATFASWVSGLPDRDAQDDRKAQRAHVRRAAPRRIAVMRLR
jgi:hypothetical protein